MDLKACVDRYYYNVTVSDVRMLTRWSGGGMSSTDYMYLCVMSYHEDCTVSMLSDILRISKPAVTKKVTELIAKGLAHKTQSKTDKRVFYLRVSESFLELCSLYDRPLERAVRAVEAEFSTAELDRFCHILDRFTAEFTKEDQ